MAESSEYSFSDGSVGIGHSFDGGSYHERIDPSLIYAINFSYMMTPQYYAEQRALELPGLNSRQRSMQQRTRPMFNDRLASPCKRFYYSVGKGFYYLATKPSLTICSTDRWLVYHRK